MPVLPERPLAERLSFLGIEADREAVEQDPEWLASILERGRAYDQTFMTRALFRDDVVYAIYRVEADTAEPSFTTRGWATRLFQLR